MTTQRLNEVFPLALAAKRVLSKRGSIKRNQLPKVSFLEHQWLCEHHTKMAAFTRCFDYLDNEYVDDVNRPTPARRPTIREIWVGSRSLACIGEDEVPEGHQRSQAEQEDAAELTDLQTMLYDDPVAFDHYIEKRVSAMCRAANKPAYNWIWRKFFRKLALADCPKDKDGNVVKCMTTDDDTGEYRPIRNGDVINTAHGSNENLDALYMDEPQDPRSEDDEIIRDLTRSRVNANTDFEQDMLNDRRMVLPSREDDIYHNDLYLLKVAAHLAGKMIERKPSLEPQFLSLREEAFRRIKAAHGELRTDNESKILSGRWVNPKDIWDDNESNIRNLEQHLSHQRKLAPAPVDWDLIRNSA